MIRENPVFKRLPSGSLVLKPSPEALKVSAPGASGGRALFRAKKPEEVEEAAWAHVIATGGDSGNAELVLSHSTIEFGKYQGQTFE
ncbi:hypothetical protein SKAU_G00277950 [Synaphobranchus kaupii]|uniref:Uncharacterized protein n=1 Tax=Synaphobranchus kaupii TaxID=118154 RepID=A0A9Q1EWN4_SYNKA|nr:hypothetical protein SKAU_G00277950 [Synaphobranchus kaupii]